MKKILLLIILLGLTSCGSDERPAKTSEGGENTEAQTAALSSCKDACLEKSSLKVAFSEAQVPRTPDERSYSISLCEDEEKKNCSKLDEVTCKDNACYSQLGLVGEFNENNVIVLSYQGFYSSKYSFVRSDELSQNVK